MSREPKRKISPNNYIYVIVLPISIAVFGLFLFYMELSDILFISLQSSLFMIIYKGFLEVFGHKTKRFTMFQERNIVLFLFLDWMIWVFFILVLDFLYIYIIIYYLESIEVSPEFVLFQVYFAFSIIGTIGDLFLVNRGRMTLYKRYSIFLLFFNWISVFAVKGVVFLILLEKDVITFIIPISIIIVLLFVFHFLFMRSRRLSKRFRERIKRK